MLQYNKGTSVPRRKQANRLRRCRNISGTERFRLLAKSIRHNRNHARCGGRFGYRETTCGLVQEQQSQLLKSVMASRAIGSAAESKRSNFLRRRTFPTIRPMAQCDAGLGSSICRTSTKLGFPKLTLDRRALSAKGLTEPSLRLLARRNVPWALPPEVGSEWVNASRGICAPLPRARRFPGPDSRSPGEPRECPDRRQEERKTRPAARASRRPSVAA